jgi:hypothetical protein
LRVRCVFAFGVNLQMDPALFPSPIVVEFSEKAIMLCKAVSTSKKTAREGLMMPACSTLNHDTYNDVINHIQ